MSKAEFKTFTCSFPYEGGQWGFDIMAVDFADAQSRLKAIGWGKVDGEVVARIPAMGGAGGIFVRIGCWWRNRRNQAAIGEKGK